MLLTGLAAWTHYGCGDDDSALPDSGTADPAGGGDGDSPPGPDAGPGDDGDVWNPPDAGKKGDPDLSAQDPEDRMCAAILTELGERVGPNCSAETGRCVVGCADADDGEACRESCAISDTYDADSGVACNTCLTVRSLKCFSDRGCSTKRLFCCIDDKCGGVGGPEGCVDAMCQPELQALTACVASTPAALECLDFEGGPVSSCFADEDQDAGR